MSIQEQPLYGCIDIGGTSIKYGVVTPEGTIVHQGLRASEAAEGAGRMVANAITAAKSCQKKYTLAGIAVSTAGMVDAQSGRIIFADDHLPDYTGMEVQKAFQEALGLPCHVENDVNCAGLGEYWLGQGKKAQSMVCLTLGTGIGGSILLQGKLWHGACYGAGEFGMMPMDDGEKWEHKASAKSLLKNIAIRKDMADTRITLKQFAQWYRQRDAATLAAVADFQYYLALGISRICCVVNPELVVLGGGISMYGDMLMPGLQKCLDRMLLPAIRNHTKVEFASLRNNAGMLGALYGFLQHYPQK